VNPPLEPRAGRAALWRGAQLAAVSALAVARLLVLARLLGPDDVGLFAIAAVALGLAAGLTDPGIVPALVLRPDPSTRELDAGWTVGVIRGALVAAALATWAGPIVSVFHEPRAAPVLRALALVPLVQAFTSIGTVGLTRRLDFRALALVQVADAAANTAVAVTLAAFAGVWALVGGALAGSLAAVIASYALAPSNPRLVFDRAATRPLVAFGGWLLATGVLAAATDFILRAAIARRLGAGPLGVFALAAGLAFLPVSAAAEVLRAVSFPLYARLAVDLPALRRAFRTLATVLGVALVPAYAVLAAGAAGIAEHLLDPRWAGAAPVIRVIALACMLGLVGEAGVPLLQGLGLSRLVVVLEIAQLGVVALLAGWLTGALGTTGAALTWLAAAGASLALTRMLLHRILGRAPNQRHRIGAIVGSGAVAAVVTLAVQGVLQGVAGTLLGMAAGLGAAAVVLWQVDRRWRLDIREDLRVLLTL